MSGLLRDRPGRKGPPPEGVTERQWLLIWYLLRALRAGRNPELIGLDQAHALGFVMALEIDYDAQERLGQLLKSAADHARADGAAERQLSA